MKIMLNKNKVNYFEKTMKSFEKERSELIVRYCLVNNFKTNGFRATMAEEQLKNLQEHLRTTTQEYSRKIHELKKRVNLLNHLVSFCLAW